MRVLLADDHPLVRQGIRLYLESMGIEIVGEASNGVEAIQLVRDLQPDIVVMDIHMPELTGIEATHRIRIDHSDTQILILTAYDEPAYIHALLEAGADGFVLKTASLSDLFQSLHEVYLGKSAFTSDSLDKAIHYRETNTPSLDPLTVREIDVLTHAARGLTNKQIGHKLFISDRTVQGHMQNVYQKLGVGTRTEAVTTALGRGIITMDEGDSG